MFLKKVVFLYEYLCFVHFFNFQEVGLSLVLAGNDSMEVTFLEQGNVQRTSVGEQLGNGDWYDVSLRVLGFQLVIEGNLRVQTYLRLVKTILEI